MSQEEVEEEKPSHDDDEPSHDDDNPVIVDKGIQTDCYLGTSVLGKKVAIKGE